MKCANCDAELSENAKFCQNCGAATTMADPSTESPRDRFTATAAATNSDEDEPEDVLWQGRYSAKAMVGTWIVAAIVTVALLGVGAAGLAWVITLPLVAVIWISLGLLLLYRQLSIHYLLTNQRFIHETGLLSREINRIEAIDIDDVAFSQGPVERIFDVGTVRMASSDTSHPVLNIVGIERVAEVASLVDDVRRAERRKRGLHIEAV